MSKITLNDRTVVVTGAGSGLGAAMTVALCTAGANVVAVDRVFDGLDRLAAEIEPRNAGGQLHAITIDLREPSSGDQIVRQTVEIFGGIFGLVNNAGVGLSTIREDYYVNNLRFWEVPDERWQAIFDTNVTAGFRLAKAAIPHMLAQGRGRIVNVTTSLDTMIRRGWTPYGPSKAALEACAAIWAQDLADTGVTVNVLVPGGPANTPLVPAASSPDREAMIQPEVMKAPVLWLMSDEADHFTGRRVTGVGWDTALPPREAAERASVPAAWPGVGQQSVWPERRR